jgi:hypothetical protein
MKYSHALALFSLILALQPPRAAGSLPTPIGIPEVIPRLGRPA